MAISMLKIRRPLGRLIFNMGIAIPGKTVFLIETAPWSFVRVIYMSSADSSYAIRSFDISFVINLNKLLNKKSGYP